MTFASDSRYRRRMLKKALVKAGVPDDIIGGVDLDKPPHRVADDVEEAMYQRELAMADAEENKGSIACVLVVTDEQLLQRNQIVKKLGERGLRVVRSYPSAKKPTAGMSLEDVGCICMQAAYAENGHVSLWKHAADSVGARFFFLHHQSSGLEWKRLEEWVGEVMSGASSRRLPERAQPKLGDVVVEGLRKNLKDEQDRSKSLEERLRKAEASLEALTRETKSREERYSSEMAVLITERNDLRETLAKTEQRLESLKKSERTATHNLGVQRDQHLQVIASKDAEIASLVEKLARATTSPKTGEPAQVTQVTGLDPDVVIRYLALRQEGLLTWTQVGERLEASAKKAKGT